MTHDIICEEDDAADCSTESSRATEITAYHFLILCGMFLVTFALYVGVVHLRLRRRGNFLKHLPRQRLPVGRDDLGSAMHKRVVDEAARVASADARVLPDPAKRADMGWGQPGTMWDNCHFRTSIAYSFHSVEEAAVRQDPSLRRGPRQSVHDYIAMLRTKCPTLDPALCDAYLDAYESARFSPQVVTYETFERFMRDLLKLVGHFEELDAR